MQQPPMVRLDSTLLAALSSGQHSKSQDSGEDWLGIPHGSACVHGQTTSTFPQQGPFCESHLGGHEQGTANQGTATEKAPFLDDIFMCPAGKHSISLQEVGTYPWSPRLISS